jgi:hypothetical protein
MFEAKYYKNDDGITGFWALVCHSHASKTGGALAMIYGSSSEEGQRAKKLADALNLTCDLNEKLHGESKSYA